MDTGLIAILIILCIIVGAIWTKKCTEFLLIGSLLGAMVLYGGGFLTQWSSLLQTAVADNVWILLTCGLFGSLIALLQESKGSFGFAKLVTRLCNSEKKTLLTTFVMGILIFVDDYLNVLSIGVCMKGVYDKRKLPRESLAYLLDSTGAPVCVLLPFSTWAVFYATLFAEQESVMALGVSSGLEAYIRAIPFAFYPIVTLVIVFLFCIGVVPKLGPMKKAYERVAKTGKVYSDASRKYNHEEYAGYEQEGNLWDFALPMLSLVAVTVATTDLMTAVLVALVVCFVLYVPRKVVRIDNFLAVIVRGFADMLPVTVLLTLAFVLQNVMGQMGLSEYVIMHMEPLLAPSTFPAIAFILVAALCFTTGSFWGMSALAAPIIFPLGAAVGANPVLIMAAIISGGAFGSHACIYGDATVLAATGAGIENMEHVTTQLPYVLMASAVSIAAFLVCGMTM